LICVIIEKEVRNIGSTCGNIEFNFSPCNGTSCISSQSKFSDIPELLSTELSFVNSISDYDKNLLKWKQEPDLINTKSYLQNIIDILSKVLESNNQPGFDYL
jgi:hypothetical protein